MFIVGSGADLAPFECLVVRCSIDEERQTFCAEENNMPVIAGFDKLASVPEERITDKIRRRVVSGKQGTMVYWRIKAGARAAAHKHPHEQFVWMVKGTMDFRIGNDKRTMKPGDVAVIPGDVEHEGYFPEDSEVIDFFAPVREDFLTGAPPSYMALP
jgi:quercetin dioxygenase-like cupin family protein